MLNRLHQALLLVSTLLLSWLGMMVFHLLGHLVYAVMADALIFGVELQPFSLSAEPKILFNPRPMLVAWGGPIWGSALPILLLWMVRATRPTWTYLATFFAGFCLIANGAHLAFGAFIPAGDAKQMLRLGMPQWVLVAFGFPVLVAGIGLLHGLSKPFGIGVPGGMVNRRHAWGVTAAWMLLAVVEWLLHTRL
ncbi:MAG: hypothetical protein AB7I37_10170 [Pirellulales bacterium]